MRKLHAQRRLSFATFPEIHWAVYSEAFRVAEDLGWTIENERGQARKPNGAYIVNCLLCAALDQSTQARDEALRRGDAILKRLGASDKAVPFDLTDSGPSLADPPVAEPPRVKGVRGRVIGERIHPGQHGDHGADAIPVVQHGKRQRP